MIACAKVVGIEPYKNTINIINKAQFSTKKENKSSVVITGFETASNILYYTAWVEGRNCDLPYINVRTLKKMEGAKLLAWLNPNSATSTGWVDASSVGLSYTTRRSGACVGGPYCNKKFTYEVQLIYKSKKYIWSFYGYEGEGTYWSKCTTHTPRQLSFTESNIN